MPLRLYNNVTATQQERCSGLLSEDTPTIGLPGIWFDIISSVYHIFSRFSILYLSLMHVTIHENGSGA